MEESRSEVEVEIKNNITYLTLRNKGIRCPQCLYNGEESRVNTGIGMCTSAGVQTYYDEKGRYHKHDRNVTCGTWTCSNGHVGDIRTMRGCTQSFCEHTGYEILTTNPAEYKVARAERRRIEEEKRKEERKKMEERKKSEESSINTGVTPLNTGFTLIGNSINPLSTATIGSTYYTSAYPAYTFPGTYSLPIIPAAVIQVKMTINGVEYEGVLSPKITAVTQPAVTQPAPTETAPTENPPATPTFRE